MSKARLAVALFLLVIFFAPNHVLATPLTWSTSSHTSFFQETNSGITDYDSRVGPNFAGPIDSSTGLMMGSILYGRSTISYSGEAAAERGVLHAESVYSIVGPIGDFGVQSFADYEEYGVMAVDVQQPDLLAGIMAYKITVQLNGQITGIGSVNDVDISGQSCQGTICRSGNAEAVGAGSNFIGPISFYVQPANPQSPFNLDLQLETLARSLDVAPFGSSNYLDTATLTSITPVDVNNNPVQGAELELSDGTYLGPNGYSTVPDGAPIAPTPEPGSLVLLGTGALALIGAARRRRMQKQGGDHAF